MELRHYLFILENVASLCKVSHFAISATEYFRLYDLCVNFKIDIFTRDRCLLRAQQKGNYMSLF